MEALAVVVWDTLCRSLLQRTHLCDALEYLTINHTQTQRRDVQASHSDSAEMYVQATVTSYIQTLRLNVTHEGEYW